MMSDARTTFDEFVANSQGRRTSSVSQRFTFDTETPVSLYLKLRSLSEYSFLFESVEGGRALGRYSIIGVAPSAVVTMANGNMEATLLREEAAVVRDLCRSAKDPLELLRSLVAAVVSEPLPDKPRFSGGWVGYFGYDSVQFIERIPIPPREGATPPDVVLALFLDVVVIDNVSRTVTIISNALLGSEVLNGQTERTAYDDACRRIDNILGRLSVPLGGTMPERAVGRLVDAGPDRSTFEENVRRAQEYIRAGDIFQVVLSRHKTISLAGDPLTIYRALRRINPSPYMYHLSFGPLQVIGSSPEMLVRVEERSVQTRPIAGTRPRGSDDAEDEKIEADLRADAKERAEHLMLVDLARNDLGKICIPGTVRLPDFMTVEKFSHVMHLCSTVTGVLRDGSSPIDALYACFPAGTLSGAPKVRAMQIIAELEQGRRGVYGGAIGYVDLSGNLDTCIAIRTIIGMQGTYRLQAGAGIVYDSVAEKEYRETEDKMSALIEAMKAAGYDETAS